MRNPWRDWLEARPALARRLAPPVPRLAVEIGRDRVVAARGGPQGSVQQAGGRPLAEGLVTPSAKRPNIADTEAVAAAIRELLAQPGLAVQPGEEATLLVPDLTARIFVVDFDALPTRHEELEALVRFRLRKSLPFDPERAVIGCEVASGRRGGGAGRVVAAVADRARLDEYEACVEASGVRAAVVVPSGLACLSAHPALEHGTLLVRAEPGSLVTAYCRRGRVEFYRVMEIQSTVGFEDIAPSAAYYRDHWSDTEAGGHALFLVGLSTETSGRLRSALPWAEFRDLEVRADDGQAAAAQLLAVAGGLQGAFA